MSFNSEIFLFLFLPLFLIVYFILPKKVRKYWLLISNFIFYSYAGIRYLYVLVFSIIVNYLFGIMLTKINDSKQKKILLVMGIFINIFILSYFKYFNSIMKVISTILVESDITIKALLPIGISFYTFQGLSYIIDTYRGKIKTNNNPINFALYMTFFPTVVSGPLLRYNEFEPSIDNINTNLNNFTVGLKKFILGLSKKVILADSLALIANNIWGLNASDLTSIIAWLGAISYTLQIYLDFSGYSDMAIGLGKMLGFDVPSNFNYPYTTKSITKFWRSWHITLSNWFKDYVYIPLGGNRKNQLFNIFVVFLLTGIWHGSGLTFILWGIWHALFNMLEKILKLNIDKENNILVSILKHIYVLIVVIIGFVFFRSPDVTIAQSFISAMFLNNQYNNPGFSITWFLTRYNVFILLISVIGVTPIFKRAYEKLKSSINDDVLLITENIVFLLLLILSVMTIIISNFNSFIYFQF